MDYLKALLNDTRMSEFYAILAYAEESYQSIPNARKDYLIRLGKIQEMYRLNIVIFA